MAEQKIQPRPPGKGYGHNRNTMADFWRYVRKTPTCWKWIGDRNTRNGYGRFHIHLTYRRAHRVSYELAYGKIPPGKLVLHKCNVPACVRPDHLYAGTISDNSIDCVKAGSNNNMKLTPAIVHRIRAEYRPGRSGASTPGAVGIRTLAKRYGLAEATVARILKRQTWAWI